MRFGRAEFDKHTPAFAHQLTRPLSRGEPKSNSSPLERGRDGKVRLQGCVYQSGIFQY